MFEMLIGVGKSTEVGPGRWYLEDDEWYYCAKDAAELKDICSAFLDDTNPNQIRTVTRSGQSHDIPLNNIDTRYVTSMAGMFINASNFNQNISDWDTSNVTRMARMFNGATSFNQNISNWDVSNVTIMQYMFLNATSFNQPIGDWNVSNVIDMYQMFDNATSFNQNISNWNVRNAREMRYMFRGATRFNRNLSKWCVTNIKSKPNYFDTGSALTTANLPRWGTCPNG